MNLDTPSMRGYKSPRPVSLDSSNLTELSEQLKTFLTLASSAAEIKRLREAADEFHTAVMRAALIAGHPAWYAAAGRIASALYLYQNWIMQRCRADNLRALNGLADTLSADIHGRAETMITEASVKEIMKYLDARYDFSSCVLDEQFLLIFLIPNRHRTDAAEIFAHCFAMGAMADTDFEKYDPFHTVLPEHKRTFGRYMEAVMARLDRQREYYAAINACNNAGESTVFIEFMLSAIKASLMEAIRVSAEMSDTATDKSALRWNAVRQFLERRDYITNANVRTLCGVSAATANRVLASFVTEGKLVKCRESGHWAYRLKE